MLASATVIKSPSLYSVVNNVLVPVTLPAPLVTAIVPVRDTVCAVSLLDTNIQSFSCVAFKNAPAVYGNVSVPVVVNVIEPLVASSPSVFTVR